MARLNEPRDAPAQTPERSSDRPPEMGSSAYRLARALLVTLGGALGYAVGQTLLQRDVLSGALNLLYLTLLGVLLGLLVSPPLARRLDELWRRLARAASAVPPQAVLAAIVGATVALVITVLLNTLLSDVPGFTWYWSLLLTMILVTASAGFFVKNRELFGFLSPAAPPAPASPTQSADKVLDTSAIIDGRIADVAEANFLDGKLLIPRFVLRELQSVADSSDPLRRNRARRGLEILDKLIHHPKVVVEIIADDADAEKVDDKLIQLCQARQAALITTDYNLNRVAALQQIRVLNVNQLAGALKPTFLPGERLALYVVKEGREAGQGLAYLDDGTMVVIDGAQAHVGETIDAIVTSNLQTNMGRMIFARLERAEG